LIGWPAGGWPAYFFVAEPIEVVGRPALDASDGCLAASLQLRPVQSGKFSQDGTRRGAQQKC